MAGTLGTGEQLDAYIDQWAPGLDERQRQYMDPYITMGHTLAQRLPAQVNPAVFTTAVNTLISECMQEAGAETPPRTYARFSVVANVFARNAFGHPFADEISTLRRAA